MTVQATSVGEERSELVAAARAYVDGEARVQQRRDEWEPAMREVIRPMFAQAADLIESQGVRVYVRSGSEGQNLGYVNMQMGHEQTGVHWDHAGKRTFLLEVGAAFGYSQAFDGRVVVWRVDHHFFHEENLPNAVEVKFYESPAKIKPADVLGDIARFLRDAIQSSYRNPDEDVPRAAGFRCPPIEDGEEKAKSDQSKRG